MPYLQKPKKRTTRAVDPKKKERSKVYNSAIWPRMRRAHLMEHPLCEICKARGIVTPADDVHHKDSFTRYDGERMLDVAYNPENLISVCRGCHNWLHHGKKVSGLNIEAVIKQMNDEFGPNRP